MAIPTYDHFIEPILRYLAQNADGARTPEVQKAVADALGITEDERVLLLPSGTQRVYQNRTGWAHDRLKRAGLSSSPKWGFWKLTEKGLKFAEKNASPLSSSQIAQIGTVVPGSSLKSPSDAEPAPITSPTVESPDDRLDSALIEINESVGNELLEIIMETSPKFFEFLVLDLLHAMGYGTSRADLHRVGGSGDAGIDGVISLDRLGLEKVYVQAKRWQQTVGRPEVQSFYGALAGQRASKGVFITTSTYTKQALDFVQSVERIVLIDGQKLTALMIEHGVGVSHRPLKVPKVDTDYFTE